MHATYYFTCRVTRHVTLVGARPKVRCVRTFALSKSRTSDDATTYRDKYAPQMIILLTVCSTVRTRQLEQKEKKILTHKHSFASTHYTREQNTQRI